METYRDISKVISSSIYMAIIFYENQSCVMTTHTSLHQPLTVNQERYRAMITDFVMPIVRENGMEHFWFQQDGTPPHTALATVNLLKSLFPGCLISKNGDFDWPDHRI